MKKELFSKLVKEWLFIAGMFLISLIGFSLIYYNENFLVVFRTVLSIFWIFVLPGYFIMFYWHEKLSFVERFVIGMLLFGGIIGIASYYLGIVGINIKYHTILLPLLFIVLGFFVNLKKEIGK